MMAANDPKKMDSVDVSVVIPVYNSEECLDDLLKSLTSVAEGISPNYEIILVNDASRDGSWAKIVKLSKTYRKLKGINFKKNFGQDNALMAGLTHSRGRKVVIMDDDLQHNPADMPLLLKKVDEGFDVCYANFVSKKQTWFKNFGSWFNGKIANIVISKPDNIYLSPYKAISRDIVNEILKYDGPFPYVDGLIFSVTQNISQVTVSHHERLAGKGNYSLIKSIGVWSRLATNFSVAPLRISMLMGFLFAIFSFFVALIFSIQHFIYGKDPSGWASMIVTMLFLGGIQMVMVGIIGEYIGRLALYQNRKPQFVIDKIIEAE